MSNLAQEQHFTIQEIAKDWKISDNSVRKIFRHMPGVLKLKSTRGKIRHEYVMLRVPKTLVERVRLEREGE